MKKKVAVAMSGGVDSGVAASLLVDQDHDVIGFFMRLWVEDTEKHGKFIHGMARKWENKCCSVESLEAARKTAHLLGIPLYTIDYAKEFKKFVVDYFLHEYAAGRTPNPCVICNKFVKFGKLLDYARGLGCEYLATGHYARVIRGSGYHLLKGVDDSKDQSYFLWTLTQEKLAHILFPVGDLTKKEVRKIAAEKKLPVAKRPESMEICFVAGDDYRDFLARHIPEAIEPGPVVDTAGKVIGRHHGLPFYTIGQRKGFEVESRVPLYVLGVDLKSNALIVGRGGESERQKFAVEDVNWIDENVKCQSSNVKCQIRVRYQGELLSGMVKLLNGQKASVELDEPARGITPGQSAVFYQEDEVLGGGIIV